MNLDPIDPKYPHDRALAVTVVLLLVLTLLAVLF